MQVVYVENKALHKISDQEVAQRLASGLELVDLDLSEYSGIINAGPGRTFVGCSFRKRTFKDAHWSGLTFEGCDFTGAVFEGSCVIADCRFGLRQVSAPDYHATLLDDVVFDCVLRGIKFDGVRLDRTSFKKARFESGRETNSIDQAEGENTVFGNIEVALRLARVMFCNAVFHGPMIRDLQGGNRELVFNSCNFDNIELVECAFNPAKFWSCSFRWADLGVVFSGGTELTDSDFRNARWHQATLHSVTIDRTKLWPCEGLTGRFQADLQKVHGAERAFYARNRVDSWVSWSRIRWISSVPLFGVSYFALVAICIWANAVRWSNTQITRWKADGRTAEWLASIDHIPTGWRMTATLSAIILLAIGATIYRVRCPDEIQENSETYWTFNLKEERMRYLALAVTKPWSRYIAGITSYFGAAYILLDLSARVIESFAFLWSNAI